MKYKPTLLAALLAAALALAAAGCTQDESVSNDTTDAVTTAAPPVTTAAPGTTSAPDTTTASETTAAPAAEPVNVTVSDLADGFTVRTVGLPGAIERLQVFRYDDIHLLFYIQQQEQLRLAIFDTESGKFVAECTVDCGEFLPLVHYGDSGLVLFRTDTNAGELAYTVTFADGRLTAEQTARVAFPYVTLRVDSPGGRYRADQVSDDSKGHGGIDLHLPDGTVKRIFENILVGDRFPDGATAGFGASIVYRVVDFLDNTNLLYEMVGYEHSGGFAVYDVETGKSTTFKTQECYDYLGTHDGAFYAAEPDAFDLNMMKAYWKITPDGSMTRLYTIDTEHPALDCLDFCWMKVEIGEGTTAVTVYAPDLDGTLAELSLDAAMQVNHYLGVTNGIAFAYAEGNDFYLFAPGLTDAVYAGNPPAPPETAASPETTAPPVTTAAPATTSAPVTTAPLVTTAPPVPANAAIPTATEVSEGLGISFVGDTYTVRTVPLPGKGSNRSYFGIDERYTLFYTYDPAHGNQNQQLHLFDSRLGMFVSTYDFDETVINAFNATYFRGDLFYITDGKVAYAVDYASGVLRLSPADVAWTREDCRVTSPDGRYVAYRVTEGKTNEERLWHIDLRMADGSVKRLLISELRTSYYTPVQFLDNTKLLYRVADMTSITGHKIIDVETGEITSLDTDRDLYLWGVADGVMYVHDWATGEYGHMSADGQMTVLGTLPPEGSDKIWGFAGNCWKEDLRQSDDTLVVTLNTLDPGDAMLARFEITEERNRDLIWLPGEDCMYIIARDLSATRTPAVEEYDILETADGYTVRTVALPGVGAQYQVLELDERYRLFITYDPISGSAAVKNQELHLFDTESGTFTASCPITEPRLLDRLLHDGGMTYLYAQSGAAGEVYRPVAAVTLDYGPSGLNVLNAIPGQIKPLWETVTSPDGKYTVQHTYLGDIDVLLPDGTEKRLLSRIDEGELLPNGQIAGMADFISYSPVAFVDNTRLLYSMGGYEWSRGFALIDVATGVITEFPDCAGYSLLGYADGVIYAAKGGKSAYSTDSFWQITLDGQKNRIYAFPEEEQSDHEATLDYSFCGDAWVLSRRDGYNTEPITLTAWSRDFTERLAVVEVSADVYRGAYCLATGDALCLIGHGLPETPAPVETAVHSYDLAYTYRGGVLYDDRSFHVSLELPTTWMPDGIFHEFYEGEQKRLSLHNSLYRESFEDFRAELATGPAGTFDLDSPITGTTRSGHRYVGYRLLSIAVQTEPLERDWYLFCFDVGEGYTYRLGVLAYPGDGDDYLERVLHPVIESVTVTLGEPVRPFGTLHFSHRIFTSATTLRFYIDEADPRCFAVRYYDSSSGLDLALPLTIPEGLTYDSARPIYAGGGGGSGECEFIVEFRQGDAVTYVSFNNFAYTDHTNWLNFDARIVDAAYVDNLRQAMPDHFH